MGLWKCTQWPPNDLDPRSWLWHWLAKKCFSARLSENCLMDRYKTLHFLCPSLGHYLIRFWIIFGGNLYFGKFSLKNLYVGFFKVKHYFGHISGMVGPIDVKRNGNASVGYWVQYVTVTFDLTHDLDLGCFKVKFEIALSQELLVWLMWNENEISWYDTGPNLWLCPLTTHMTLTLEMKVQGQSFKKLYLRNGTADWHGTKRMWVIHSWPWYWLVWPWWGGQMYWIVTVVTSDVGVLSTYLVHFIPCQCA